MTNAAGVTITDKSCLIMDEVDGMSAGDRGGVGALAALIKKTKVCHWPPFSMQLAARAVFLMDIWFGCRFRSFVSRMIGRHRR